MREEKSTVETDSEPPGKVSVIFPHMFFFFFSFDKHKGNGSASQQFSSHAVV